MASIRAREKAVGTTRYTAIVRTRRGRAMAFKLRPTADSSFTALRSMDSAHSAAARDHRKGLTASRSPTIWPSDCTTPSSGLDPARRMRC
jgi:hypothetical protein